MKWVLLCALLAISLQIHAADDDDDSSHAVRRVEYLTEKKDKDDKPVELSFAKDVRKRSLKQIVDYLSYASGMNITLRSAPLGRLIVDIDLSSDSKHPKTWRDDLEAICRKYKLKVDDSQWKDKIIEVYKPALITADYKDADIHEVLDTIAAAGHLNIVVDPDVKGKVTATLKDMPCEDALDVVVKSIGYIVVNENDALRLKKDK